MATEPFDYLPRALRHLHKREPCFRAMRQMVGPFTLKIHRDRFRLLAQSIISQQISTRAAAAISARLQKSIKPSRLTPEALLAMSDAQLRGIGLSPQKLRYLRHLAEMVSAGEVNLRRIHAHDDETVIEQLTRIKGIGRWTAEMFLIFGLGRPDVLPADDFGLKLALKLHDGRSDLPTPTEVRARAEAWRPYATVGTWYCWQWLGKVREQAKAEA